MKVCPNCNTSLADESAFCTACGCKLERSNSIKPAAPVGSAQPFVPATPSDNRRIFCILAYIPFLWLFGLFSSPEKFDSRVKFNVGQGIIATITSAACCIIASIMTVVNNSIFRTEISYFGYATGNYTVSAIATVLNALLWLIVLGITAFYAVYGIIKVSKNNDSYLPIIGKLAFYK